MIRRLGVQSDRALIISKFSPVGRRRSPIDLIVGYSDPGALVMHRNQRDPQ